MSKSKSVVLIVIIILFVLGWIWASHSGNAPTSSTSNEQVNGTSSSASLLPTKDSSNASLDKDGAAVDNQLNSLGSDSTEIDSSLNDSPVPQTQ